MDARELLFDVAARITGSIDFGASLPAIAARKAAPPPEGAWFDLSIEGTVEGPRLNGRLVAVDHVTLHADGRLELHAHARVELADGGRVSVSADGLATPDSRGVVHIRETWTLRSNSPAHAWVNSTPVQTSGTVNLGTGELRLKGYRA